MCMLEIGSCFFNCVDLCGRSLTKINLAALQAEGCPFPAIHWCFTLAYFSLEAKKTIYMGISCSHQNRRCWLKAIRNAMPGLMSQGQSPVYQSWRWAAVEAVSDSFHLGMDGEFVVAVWYWEVQGINLAGLPSDDQELLTSAWFSQPLMKLWKVQGHSLGNPTTPCPKLYSQISVFPTCVSSSLCISCQCLDYSCPSGTPLLISLPLIFSTFCPLSFLVLIKPPIVSLYSKHV